MKEKSFFWIQTIVPLVLLVSLLLSYTVTPAQGWYDTNWLYRKAITIKSNQVDADLTNFPVLIDITDPDLASGARSDGFDILFTNAIGTSQLHHEIEYYADSTGDLVAWVEVPFLDETTDTILYMYYGNPGVMTSQEDVEGTWDGSNYVMVQHLEETSGPHEDSTLNNNDGTAEITTNQNATGNIDGADEFNGLTGYVRVPNNIINDSLQFGEDSFTAEAWIYPHSVTDTGGARIVNNRGTGTGGSYKGWQFKIKSSGSGWIFGDSSIDDAVGPYEPYDGPSPYGLNQWYHVVMVYEADSISPELRFYVDGALDGSLSLRSYGSISNSLPTVIGASIAHEGDEDNPDKQFFDGIIDEVRLSDTVRSGEWISASYRNKNDPGVFYTVGELEGAPSVSNPEPADGAVDVSITLTELSFTLHDPDVGDFMDYTVTTTPDIGSATVLGVPNGIYSLTVSGLDYETTYQWDISVADGSRVINKSYSFTTEKEPGPWWDCAWDYRKAITIDQTKVAEDLNNFPVLIAIDDGSLLPLVQNDADDIAFTDYDGVPLNHEVENYNPSTGALVAWVSVPVLSSTEGTHLYMYYGNSAATNQETTAVWDINYAMVHHLDETSGTHYDSTENANDGTPVDVLQVADGKIDGAVEFDGILNGTGDVIDVGTDSSMNVFGPEQDFSIFLWAKRATTTALEGFFSSGSSAFYGIYFGSSSNDEDDLRYMSISPGGVAIASNANVIADTEWHHVGMTADRDGDLQFWVDGVSIHSASIASHYGEDWNRLDDTYKIGTDRSENNPMDGIIDEVRLSDIVRGAGWIQTSYTNQNDPSAFSLWGGEETPESTGLTNTYYLDYDGDTFGDPDNATEACTVPVNHVEDNTDCDDEDPTVNPGALDLCDDIDNNCDGEEDENYNVGDCSVGVGECYTEGEFVCTQDNLDTECNAVEGTPSDELCDSKDNDCDAQTDEELGTTTCGIGVCERIVDNCVNGTTQECIPGDPTPESCDLSDNDCDGSTDEDLGETSCGLGVCQHTVQNCVNGIIQICDPFQGASDEICDSFDNDCDGLTDEENAIGCINYYRDEDGDGYGQTLDVKCLCATSGYYTTTQDGDCNDADVEMFPGNPEVCDEKDNNCNGTTDEEDATGCTVYYRDSDYDTYGVTSDYRCLCSPEGDYTTTQDGDCDDANAAVNPSAVEVCDDGIDNDCDGEDDVTPEVVSMTAPVDPIQLGDTVTVTAELSGLNLNDTHTAKIYWGDETTSEFLDDQVVGEIQDIHTYSQAGVYTITVTVDDNSCGSDSDTYQYIVVFDPDGGFVTGGGWIDSPEGAYADDQTLTGKANFGFVSKYKKGATIPTGETEFQFKVADLNFHSDTYQWLVIAGARAMYKGTGTINGEGNYGFMLTAIDEKLTPSTDVDMFRIKIWDIENGDAIVYDNQVGAEDDADLDEEKTKLGGGSIVIHNKKK